MSKSQNNTNAYSSEQLRLSKNKDQEKSAEESKNTISKTQDKQDLKSANKECREAEKSSYPEKDLSKDKESNKQSEAKNQERHENKEGLFSRFSHVFSNAFEKAKEIIFPDTGGRDEDLSTNETKVEDQKKMERNISGEKEQKGLEQVKEKGKEREKEKGLEQEKHPKRESKSQQRAEESTTNQGVKHDKNRPTYIVEEGENKPIYYSQTQQNQGQMQESEKQIPHSGGSNEKNEGNRAKEQNKETKLFNEQPREEFSTPIKHEGKESISHGSLDQQKLMEKLEDLNLNKQEQNVEEKEEPINNENFYQDISKTLQFGDRPAQEEMIVGEKKITYMKDQNYCKIILIMYS